MTLVEAAVDTIESAHSAERAGAGRIELCASLVDGGTTPSGGLIAGVAEGCRVPAFVMIRPRGGGFVYSAAEMKIMVGDVVLARSMGAQGIVTGVLQSNATIDVKHLRILVSAAGPLPVTFHRAFDLVSNRAESLEQLIEAGVARVLTSGGATTALEGASGIASLVRQADGRIVVVAGGGIRENNVREVVRLTGVSEVHSRISSIVGGTTGSVGPKIKLRKRLPDDETAWEELDERRMRDLVQQAG